MTTVSWEDRAGERWIRIDGELDYGPCQACRADFEAAARESPGAVIVDMARVSFVASPGIQMLLFTHQMLQDRGASLVLTGLQPRIRHVFDRVGLLQTIAER